MIEALAPLIGEWDTVATHELLPDVQVPGRASFEWLPGGHFVVQRAEADHPDFPDSLWVIGAGAAHYFDSRGVQRVYESAVRDGVWTLLREEADPFWQRFAFPLGEDAFDALWERSEDEGATWEPDLAVTYRRRRSSAPPQ